jgi:tetratricopeptide (TPR) repeat protein
MAARSLFLVFGLVAGAIVFLGYSLLQRLSPTRMALKRARKGQLARAMADLISLRERKPSSPTVRGALGQLYLMDERPEEAELELRKALELGSRSAAHHNALGWALVRLGKFDEALPIAEEANLLAHEDFEVYCLYCGLMAHHGRAAEVAPLLEFLRRTSIQIQKMSPKNYENGLSEKFEFARGKMNEAGFA